MATQISKTIALRKKLVKIHRSRRLKKAVSYFKEDISRYTKSDLNSIELTGELNGYLMHEVAKNMKSVNVVITKDGASTKVDLSPELKKQKTKPTQDTSKTKDTKSKNEKEEKAKSEKKEQPKKDVEKENKNKESTTQVEKSKEQHKKTHPEKTEK
ncbi:MAG: hypothetical protein ACP5M9_01395 [Candidatus Micrarchaeia archaeon]